MKTLALAALLLTIALPAAAQKPLPTVYVFTKTDPSGLIDRDAKHRLAVVKDIRKQLDGKVAHIVDSQEGATLTLEIAGTEQITRTSSLTAMSNALNPNRPQREEAERVTIQHATLTMGEYSTDLKADAYSTQSAALAKQVKDWLKMNAERLP